MKLNQIARLQFGYYTKTGEAGNVAYLQAKHFNDLGKLASAIDTLTHLHKRNETHLLEEGDILLVGKGFRNFAWVYSKKIGPAIASSIFFVIKADQSKVIPDYLSIILNSPQTQSQFQALGAGSSIPSIRKSELEAFHVPLPPLDTQRKIVELKKLHIKDMELTRQIMAEKKKQYQAIINNIINNNGTQSNYPKRDQ